MRRPLQHQIDESAQRIFRQALPTSWVVNDHHNDYGKDYLVETSNEKDDLTGDSFYVQLKGKQKVHRRKDGKSAKFSLQSKYAAYYFGKVTDLPVYLFVIDVTSKEGWWLFLQEYLESDARWKSQQSLTVDIPIGNKIDKRDKLLRSLGDAQRWIRSRHPSAVHDAVAAHQRRLEAADPRFKVSVSYKDGGTHAQLEPKGEPVDVALYLSGEPATLAEKLRDLVERGKKVRFEDGEFAFEGSAIFSEHEPGPVEIQCAASSVGDATVILFDQTKRELARVDGIAGEYLGGRSELSFRSTLKNLPVQLEASAMNSSGATLELQFPLTVWDGAPILMLPHFDKSYGFFAAMGAAKYLKVDFFVDGNLMAAGKLSDFALRDAALTSQLVETLRKARAVFQFAKLNPKWSLSQFDEDFFDTVNETHELLFEDITRTRLPPQSFKIEIDRNTYKSGALECSTEPSALKLSSDTRASILGEEIPLGSVSYEYTNVLLAEVANAKLGKTVELEVTTTGSTVRSQYIDSAQKDGN